MKKIKIEELLECLSVPKMISLILVLIILIALCLVKTKVVNVLKHQETYLNTELDKLSK